MNFPHNFLVPCTTTDQLMRCPLMDPPRSVQAIRNRGKPQVSYSLVSQDSTFTAKIKGLWRRSKLVALIQIWPSRHTLKGSKRNACCELKTVSRNITSRKCLVEIPTPDKRMQPKCNGQHVPENPRNQFAKAKCPASARPTAS